VKPLLQLTGLRRLDLVLQAVPEALLSLLSELSCVASVLTSVALDLQARDSDACTPRGGDQLLQTLSACKRLERVSLRGVRCTERGVKALSDGCLALASIGFFDSAAPESRKRWLAMMMLLLEHVPGRVVIQVEARSLVDCATRARKAGPLPPLLLGSASDRLFALEAPRLAAAFVGLRGAELGDAVETWRLLQQRVRFCPDAIELNR
jgi:hypothetical protein